LFQFLFQSVPRFSFTHYKEKVHLLE